MIHSLFDELKRRNVFKAAVGYAILGWLILQIADVVVPVLELPEWTLKLILLLGILGFPFALFFAWAYEMTPDGIKSESDVTSAESITSTTGQLLNRVIIGLLVVSLGYFIWESRFHDDTVSNVQHSDATALTTDPTSIAVLPFVNMSSDAEQEYFSDGITEEILNVLAQVPNLKVTSRSSSFAFKGKDINISEVATKLRVNNILEGSVRKAGNKIRITAQLIEAKSDIHLWSETYDRELNDIFAIQDEISLAIVAALKLFLTDQSVIEANSKSIDPDAYNEYLIGLAKIRRFTEDDIKSSFDNFETAIKYEPEFPLAYAKLAYAWILFNQEVTKKISSETLDEKVLPLLDTALELDSQMVEAIALKGYHHFLRNRLKESEMLLDKAILLNPNYGLAYLWRSSVYLKNNQYLKMLKDIERAYELDPMDLSISENLAYQYQLFDRSEDAEKVAERMQELYPDHQRTLSIELSNYFYESQLAKAAPVLQKARELYPEQANWKAAIPFFYVKMGIINDKMDTIKYAGDHEQADFYSIIGQFEKAEEILSDMELQSPNNAHVQWHIIKHYLNSNNIDKLKLHVDRWIVAMESASSDWTSHCSFSVILAMQKTKKTDNVDTMIQDCRDQYITGLNAGYMCPCNWINLVYLALLEGRTDDAIKRIYEWLDQGSELSNINDDPYFNLLREHPEYENIVRRNNENLKQEQDEYRSTGIELM